jgi:hypothetical protein
MPPYARDPLSTWFDGVAADWLARAYRAAGRPAGLYLAPPSSVRRAQAAAELGIYDLAEKDRWGLDRWTRALKRSVYWHHKEYGYAGEFRLGDPRASDGAATALKWEMGQLIRKAGWPQRRRELALTVLPGGIAAEQAVIASTRPGKRYTGAGSAAAAYRSKPAPPDRPWEPGF